MGSYSLKSSFTLLTTSTVLQGCYVDRLYLYGGRVHNNELIGADSGAQPWTEIRRVRLTPVDISRVTGARVVRIPLHTRYPG